MASEGEHAAAAGEQTPLKKAGEAEQGEELQAPSGWTKKVARFPRPLQLPNPAPGSQMRLLQLGFEGSRLRCVGGIWPVRSGSRSRVSELNLAGIPRCSCGCAC